ncbi:YdcF family protein [Lichenicola sp.]|uniref:YdcF family protein n=1 Tax=Lichenicola sp. TaxID=2804529 RepID=UPI003B0017B1
MILSSLATPFIVPPVNLAVLGLVALWRRRRIAALWSIAALLLLAMPVVADRLTRSLETGIAPTDAAGSQAILILGGDLDRDRNGLAVPGALTLERLREGAALARRTGLPIAVTGGPAWRGGPAIGAVMARSLQDDFGVVPRWVEGRSDDTWENARDSAAMLEPAGIHHVLVVTHAWHMRRSLLAFRHSGLVASPAPIWRMGYPSRGPAWGPYAILGAVLPQVDQWQRSYFALHEWIGIVWYRLRDVAWP